jgi:CheY-like chemotaxis protein
LNVLLVEDEAAVARAFGAFLEKSGFKVTAVLSAPDAFKALKSGTAFDAIVCDLILKNSEGSAFFDELAATMPAMAERVLFVTGWANDPASRNLLTHTGRPFLAKPVEAKDLIEAVRRIAEGKKK